MSIAYFARQIQEGEKIQKIVYRSAWMYVPSLFFAALFLWAALFFFFWLKSNYGPTGGWISLSVALISLYKMVQTFMRMKYTAWVITTKRLIDFEQVNFWKFDV